MTRRERTPGEGPGLREGSGEETEAKYTPPRYREAKGEFYSKQKSLDSEEQLKVLAGIWGERKGYVSMPWIPGDCETDEERRDSWHEVIFQWPAGKAKILDHLQRHKDDELYFRVNVYIHRESEHGILPERCLYADLDEIDPKEIERRYRPSVAWETSPGRYQAIWKLEEESAGASDPRGVNQQLTYFLEADKSGWAQKKVLRVPGTTNHKPEYGEEGAPGYLLWPAYSERYRIEDFDGLPDVPRVVAEVEELTDESIEAIDRRSLWKRVKNGVSQRVRELVVQRMEPTEDEDRSSILWEIERELADQLCSVAEIVAIVRPSVWNKYRGRKDELERLNIEAAKAISERGNIEILPDPNAPMAVAKILVQDYRDEEGWPTLRNWQGNWMRWRGTHWEQAGVGAIRSAFYNRLEQAKFQHPKKGFQDWNPDSRKIRNLMEALAGVVFLEDDTKPPVWLLGPGGSTRLSIVALHAQEIIPCTNGLLNVRTRELMDLTPQFFNISGRPFPYDATAPEPVRWLEFLDQLWPDDEDSKALLQEWCGYVLSGRTNLHKIMLMKGPKRAGKGTIARILMNLIGEAHVAWPTIGSLSTQFGMQPVLDKLLAVVGDARSSDSGIHHQAAVERMLSVSGEDSLTVDIKYKDPRTAKLSARFMLVSNETPRLTDASGALASRFVVLRFTESFLGREDHHLEEDLKEELTSILSWSLDGLDRLEEQEGRFTQPESARVAIEELKELASPISLFVEECCELGRGQEVLRSALYGAWRFWCEKNGEKPGSASVFGRDLRAAFSTIDDKRIRNRNKARDEGDREWHYVGIGLKDEEEEI